MDSWKHYISGFIMTVILMSFTRVSHLAFAQLVAGPATKPSIKLATAPPRVPPGLIQCPACPIIARFAPHLMKSKLTEQATVV